MRLIYKVLVGALISAMFALNPYAQKVEHAPDQGVRKFTPGTEVLPYKDLPFIGEETIESKQKLPEGGTITRYLTAKVIRDSKGRIYRESHHFSHDKNNDPQKTMYEFYVMDPATHTRVGCVIATHRCMITPYRPNMAVKNAPVGPRNNGAELLTRDELGQQTMEELTVTGTRETMNVSVGAMGNDKPFAMTREFWYSADLKTNIQITRSDPREGTDVIHLKIISRAEPENGVFAIPAGYSTQYLGEPNFE